MATVMIGSAHIDENGNARGGKAGDQTGKELSTQKWYLHKQGWVLIRAKDAAVREKIALAMERACANKHIGYDQGQRDSLHSAARQLGFDPGRVTTDVECDCSSLVRVCVAYAGIDVASFRTTDEVKKLVGTGYFASTTSAKYTTSPDYLLRGDILCTRTQGHTVVVMNDGDKAGKPADPEEEEQAPLKKAKKKLLHPCTLHDTPPIDSREKELPVGMIVEVWGNSVTNPDYVAVKLEDGRKGYIHKDAVD